MHKELVKEIGEKELIKRISNYMPSNQTSDDCAFFQTTNKNLLINTDLMVENTHFNDKIISPKDLGWKSVAINYSDLISSGCIEPIGITIGLVLTPNTEWLWIKDLYEGFHQALHNFGGSILIDDKNINDFDVKSLRKLTGIVTQDSILFNDTVRNNLSLGVEGLTDDQFLKALTIANAKEFVMDLEDGLETRIGEGGGKLSGGQRQRLCIARAVIQNPPLLILDEATSALDTKSEKLVQQALEKVMNGRTAIVIAHRLSTIKNADTIVVMDQGLIVEEGSHEELYARKSYYFKLCSMQELN